MKAPLTAILAFLLLFSPSIFATDPVYQSIRQVVHKIVIEDSFGTLLGTGSGVIVKDSVVVTANHVATVLPEQGKMYVEFNDQRFEALIVKQDWDNDLALLNVKYLHCPCAKVASTLPQIDRPVYTVGFPMFQFIKTQMVTLGNYQGDSGEKLIVSSPVAPGNSGGGSFYKNSRGTYVLFGIVTDIIMLPFGYGGTLITHTVMAAPLKHIKALLSDG